MEYNPIDNPIIIKCTGSSTLPIDRILEFQGNLKKLTVANRTKLFNSICLKGFIAPFFVWDNQGEYQLLDEHFCDVIVNRYKTWCSANNRTPVIKLNGEIWND